VSDLIEVDYSTFQPTPFSNLSHRPQFDQTFPSLSYLVSQALHQIELERYQSMGLNSNNDEFKTFQSILPSEKENEEQDREEQPTKPTNISSSFSQDPDKLVVPKLAVVKSKSIQVKNGGLNSTTTKKKKKKKNHGGSGDFLIGNLDLIERAYIRLGSLKARIFLSQLFSSSIPHFDSAIQLYGGWEALKNCVDSIPIFCPISKTSPSSSSSKLLMYEEDRSLDHFYPLSNHTSFIQALTTRSLQNYLINGLHSETSPFYQKTSSKTTTSSTQGTTIMELEEDGISMMTEKNMASHSSSNQQQQGGGDVYSEGKFKEEEMKCQHVLDEATSYMESRMKKKQRRVKNQLQISMKNESQQINNSVSSSSSSNFLSTQSQPSSIQFSSPKRRIVWSCSPQEVDDWMDSSSTITHFPTVLWSGKRFDP